MRKSNLQNKILIIEDNYTLRDLLHSWLNELMPDCDTYKTSTGEDGLEIIKTLKPDIVIVDIKLPGINGIDVTRMIKNNKDNTEVIVLTICEGINYQNDAYAAGANTFINKKEMHIKLPSAIRSILKDKKKFINN
jgi:DNA-binding NarL/FixJ family response regulator